MKLFYTKKDVEKEKARADELSKQVAELKRKEIEVNGKKTIVSSMPSSVRETNKDYMRNLQASLRVVDSEFNFEVIPVIRKLSKINPDVNQALNDFVKLANTGHKIKFDKSVNSAELEKARNFLSESSKSWHVGAAGINGIVNKMFYQIQIGGALSTEWIPNMSLDNLEEVRFINPENIRFVVEKRLSSYHPYQKLVNKILTGQGQNNLKRLNTNQYKYIALNGDTDLPYGTPPYIAALKPIETQTSMLENISYIIEMMGILGYVDAKIDKPNQNADESDDAYKKRLTQMLIDYKERIKGGMKDGLTVGFMDDNEVNFNQTTTNASGVKDLFEQNELLVSAGLNYDAIFMGKPGSTETLVTVMFTKMISQLTNIQNIVKENLEFGYKMALRLAGIQFNSLHVEFNKSTVTDTLKFQQAREILVRNLQALYNYGIINLDQMADELGYESADQKEPRVNIEKEDATGDQAKKEKTEKGKDASDKKGRDKKNPQGTVKRQNQMEIHRESNSISIAN